MLLVPRATTRRGHPWFDAPGGKTKTSVIVPFSLKLLLGCLLQCAAKNYPQHVFQAILRSGALVVAKRTITAVQSFVESEMQ